MSLARPQFSTPTPRRVSVMAQPAGWRGTQNTLQRMAGLVWQAASDVAMRDFALRLVQHARGHGFRDEVGYLFEFVRDEVTYRRDPVGVELVKNPRHTLRDKVGDCDDKSVLLCALLACIGHRTRFVIAAYRQPQRWQHVYCEVWLNGRWIALDPTNENAVVGWEKSYVSRASIAHQGGRATVQELAGIGSFFKKIGKGVKKVGKGAVKVVKKVGPAALSFVPGVGGVLSSAAQAGVDAIDARKAAKQAQREAGQAAGQSAPQPPVYSTSPANPAPPDAQPAPVVSPAVQAEVDNSGGGPAVTTRGQATSGNTGVVGPPARVVSPAVQAEVDNSDGGVMTRGQASNGGQLIGGVDNKVLFIGGGIAVVGLVLAMGGGKK